MIDIVERKICDLCAEYEDQCRCGSDVKSLIESQAAEIARLREVIRLHQAPPTKTAGTTQNILVRSFVRRKQHD